MDGPIPGPPRPTPWKGRSKRMWVTITLPPSGGLAPAKVTVRARPRYAIHWAAAAAFCGVMAAAANGPPPDGDVGAARFLAAISVGSLVMAWRCADLRLVATPRGVLVVNLLGWRRVRWEQLLGLVHEVVREGDDQIRVVDRMLLQTDHGLVRARAVLGEARQAGDLYVHVRDALLAMREVYGQARPQPSQSRHH